ncbi:MAG: ribosome biogenesis GTP-binding protein YihA/YsxC [bacterium]|jgi:GTP-binding protein|nr:ribosome biogenesis GTP-binding protein YihA/YsxC [bacterium]
MNTELLRVVEAQFEISCPSIRHCPAPVLPEIAIAGRSNVGKSSLINLLCNRKNLAKTSSTPGKTRLLNFFKIRIEPGTHWLHLVDLPGYGYAKVSKSMKSDWDKALGEFLEKRETLSGIIHLIDSRHEPTKLDLQMREWIVHTGIPCITVLTKVDKLKQNERVKNKTQIKKNLQLLPEEHCIETSVLNREGVTTLLQALLPLLPHPQEEPLADQ